MATINPNSFDYFRNNEIFPFIKAKQETNSMDVYRNNEIMPVIFIKDSSSQVLIAVVQTRNRIFFIVIIF